jgi:hypothetical protein
MTNFKEQQESLQINFLAVRLFGIVLKIKNTNGWQHCSLVSRDLYYHRKV